MYGRQKKNETHYLPTVFQEARDEWIHNLWLDSHESPCFWIIGVRFEQLLNEISYWLVRGESIGLLPNRRTLARLWKTWTFTRTWRRKQLHTICEDFDASCGETTVGGSNNRFNLVPPVLGRFVEVSHSIDTKLEGVISALRPRNYVIDILIIFLPLQDWKSWSNTAKW